MNWRKCCGGGPSGRESPDLESVSGSFVPLQVLMPDHQAKRPKRKARASGAQATSAVKRARRYTTRHVKLKLMITALL